MSRLDELRAGQDVLTAIVTLDANWLERYRVAIGALAPVEAPAPPLALVARAMDMLIHAVALQPGAVHSAQSFQSFAAVFATETVQFRWTVSRASRRAGAIFVNLDLEVQRASERVLVGKTHLIVPGVAV